MKTKILVMLSALWVASCGGPTAPTPVAISPSGATLRIGDSQTFTIAGGEEPFYVVIEGYIPTLDRGRTRLYDLAVYGAVVLERTAVRTMRVTFVDAKLKPETAVLTVVDVMGSTAHVPLELVY